MKNKVVFAAAGNGKTYSICKETIKLATTTKKNILIVTYTHEGVNAIETEYKKQNLGVIDENIVIKTWYSFLLSEIIKPYQCLLELKYKNYKKEIDVYIPENYISSIAFYDDDPIPKWYNSSHVQYYMNSARDIRKDNVSNLACLCIKQSGNKAIQRIEDIYECIFFDELQDYAGYDLDVFLHLFSSHIPIKCVGDYKQATFRTNNSRKYSGYRDEKIKEFFEVQQKKKLCQIKYSKTTRRFNQEICDFVNIIHNDKNNLIIPDLECTNSNVENAGVYVINIKDVEKYCAYYSPMILRYNINGKISFKHCCSILNYGASKGSTFERVVIIPTSTTIPFINCQSPIVSSQTRSKFFVACTRAKYSVVFAMSDCSNLKNFQPVKLSFADNTIDAYKFVMPKL